MSAGVDREVNAIRDAATEWVVQLGDEGVTPERRAEFMLWLRRSPAHVTEYLEAEAAWQAMTGAAARDTSAVGGIVRDLPAIVDFPGGILAAGAASRRSRSIETRRMAYAVAAMVALAIGVVVGPTLLQRFGTNVYSTQLGEMRRVSLADGSTVELNTLSTVRVEISASARDIFIDSGEAFFKVAKDAARPFRVHSAATVVRALGTEFNVYRRRGKTIVTVLQGRVAVTGPEAGAKKTAATTELTAGHRVVVPDFSAVSAAVAPSAVDPVRAVAWREQRLIFENESVGDAVAEFNRYNARQLLVEDPALGAQRISGVFKADRPDALVDFLTQTGNVRAVERSRFQTVLSLER